MNTWLEAHPRALATVQAVGGLGQMAEGVVLGAGALVFSETVVAPIVLGTAGLANLGMGADNFGAAVGTLITGQRQDTLLYQGLRPAGANPGQATMIEVGANLAVSGGSAYASLRAAEEISALNRATYLLTNHSEAHAFGRHGGRVTDDALIRRALTGVTPDDVQGSFVPSLSSAFHSDEALIFADQQIRNGGALETAIARHPLAFEVRVTPDLVGDLGVDLGRGYVRVGGGALDASNRGLPRLMTNLRSAQGDYAFNPSTGNWETISVYPAPWP